jgi:hypothetical protein
MAKIEMTCSAKKGLMEKSQTYLLITRKKQSNLLSKSLNSGNQQSQQEMQSHQQQPKERSNLQPSRKTRYRSLPLSLNFWTTLDLIGLKIFSQHFLSSMQRAEEISIKNRPSFILPCISIH